MTTELAQKYQRKTDKQHVLDNPDTYTGPMECTDYETYVFCPAVAAPPSTDAAPPLSAPPATAPPLSAPPLSAPPLSAASTAPPLSALIVPKQVNIIPGLYKLFDEGIVNCRDHVVRLQQQLSAQQQSSAQEQPAATTEAATTTVAAIVPVTEIDVSIDPVDGTITMTNNGNGIDVALHPVEKLWIPELIFGHLRTSTNYDKDQKKIVGGKNGFGFKLVLIWSTWGRIETVDHIRGLKYVQEFGQNLDIIHPPVITKCAKKPYTSVSFRIDFARLNKQALAGQSAASAPFSPDMLALFQRRVYDIAAVTDKSVKVKFNHELLAVRTFAQYVDLYLPGDKTTHPRLHEAANDRWEYVVSLAPTQEFTQVSLVNGIFTAKGGKHVDYIMGQIVRKLVLFIKGKKKVDVKPGSIREQLWLFLRCDVDNPSFDSQTKDYLSTSATAFGSTCDVSDKFIEKLATKLGVMDTACALTEVKDLKAVKKNDGTKSKSVRGIPKLVDANDAGGPRSDQCMLILCEGDSAKAGIVSGLSAQDRNTIGVYPLRGKLFNVRGETAKRIGEVKEINEIKQIMGLQAGKRYTPEEAKKLLRYGRLVFMTDQDLDGSHIKGLCINLVDNEWASLLELPGFVGFMNTPIIKAHKAGQPEKLFYNDGEYEAWKLATGTSGSSSGNWHIKYYKGLGTSTAKEFKEYFAHKKIVAFQSSGPASRDAIDMAFNKKRANDRKDWLANYNRDLYLDTNLPVILYEKFIAEELVHFSQKDCERSIPNDVDGLKTSQRKILYTCFKRRLTSEVKVAQLGGSVSEMSRYHHGEQSLYGAIINLAQDFCGSNNLNLLLPNGQFGTRLQGGNDAASERYICTQLNPLTRYLFPEADDPILTYLEDDGTPVEPLHYVPIIPLLLVNGSKGIGTGFSTDILSYNPLELIDYLLKVLGAADPVGAAEGAAEGAPYTTVEPFAPSPYYEHFTGEIRPLVTAPNAMGADSTPGTITPDKYVIKGKYTVVNDKQLRITELPVGTWTDDYKQFLEELIDAAGSDTTKKGTSGKAAASTSTTTTSEDATAPLAKKAAAPTALPLKDYTDMSTDTKVDFLLTFASAGPLSDLQQQSADHGCNALEKALKLYTTRSTSNMHAFDENKKLVKYGKVHDIVQHHMAVRYAYYSKRKAYQVAALQQEALLLANKARFILELLDNTLDLRRQASGVINDLLQSKAYVRVNDSYAYLVEMPMNSVTKENVDKLLTKRDQKAAELATLMATPEKDIWVQELQALRTAYVASKSVKVAPGKVPGASGKVAVASEAPKKKRKV